MNQLLIEARDLHKSYRSGAVPVRVLRGLSLAIAEGESVAIMGPSGSGKTTLLHLLNGLLHPDAGSLRLFGRDQNRLGDDDWARLRRTRIATLFQDGNLIPTLTVARNLAFRAGLAGIGEGAELQVLLETLGIADRAQHYPDQLSGGERQRAALACAFAIRPALMLADEPSGSLDDASTERMLPLFFDAIRARDLTTLIVTHNPRLARRCDRALELVDGALRPWEPVAYS